MRPPCSQSCISRYDPVALLDGLGAGAGGEDFETCFVSGDGGGLGRAEGGGEGGEGGVGALDLIDVGGVEGGGEGAKGEEGGVGWGDGVGVEAVRVSWLIEILEQEGGKVVGGRCTLERRVGYRGWSIRVLWLGRSRRWKCLVGGQDPA